jgi:hypothetical protein
MPCKQATPWQKAQHWALQHGIAAEDWKAKIEECLLRGWLISTPDDFVAALPAEHDAQPAYFVYMACGGSGHPLHRFMRYAPRPLPWVLWHRKNEKRQRAFRWEQLAKKARI